MRPKFVIVTLVLALGLTIAAYFGFVRNPHFFGSETDGLQLPIAMDRAGEIYSIADSLFLRAKFDSSIAYFRRASEIYKHDRNGPKLADCYNRIAENLIEKALYDDAELLIDKALNVRLEGSSLAQQIRAQSFYDLGRVAMSKANYQEAWKYHNKALDIRLEVLGEDHPDVAASYMGLGNYYHHVGIYNRAFDFYSKARDLQLVGESDLDLASNYESLADIYKNQSDFDKALTYHEEALNLRTKALGEQNPWVASSLMNIGHIYYYESEFSKALEHYARASQIILKVFGNRHPDLAWAYDNMGYIFFERGDYQQALNYYDEALVVRLATLGDDHLDLAYSYENLGHVYYFQSDFDLALANYRLALRIKLDKFDQKHPLVANTYDNIGNVHASKAEYQKALEFYNKALGIYRAAFNQDNLDVAKSYEYIGLLYRSKGELDEALKFYDKATKIYRTALGDQNDYLATVYNLMGNIYVNKNDYDEALIYLNKAFGIKSEKLGKRDNEIAWLYYDLGTVCLKKGEYERALDFFNSGLSLSLSTGHKAYVAIGYSNLGRVYFRMEDYGRALDFFHQDILLTLEVFGEGHPYIAESYNEIGDVYFALGELGRALSYYTMSLDNLKENEINHPDVATVLQNIGRIYEQERRFKRALAYYQESLKALMPGFHDDNVHVNPSWSKMEADPLLLRSLELKASALRKLYNQSCHSDDLHASMNAYELGIEVIEALRRSYKEESSKLFLADRSGTIYNEAMAVTLMMYEVTGKESFKEKAFRIAERSKANVLLESLQQGKAKQTVGIPQELIDYESDLKTNLGFYEKSLLEERSKGDSANAAKIVIWQDKVFEYKQEYEDHLIRCARDYPEYYNLKYEIQDHSVSMVQSELAADGSTLIEYFLGNNVIVIFTITSTDLEIVEVPITADFPQHVSSMRAGLVNRDYDLYAKNAFRLFQVLIKPIQESLQGEKLYVVPDGILGYLPFETLLMQEPQKGQGYQDLSYVIEKYQITYFYSANLLVENLTKPTAKSRNQPFVGFAPVNFN